MVFGRIAHVVKFVVKVPVVPPCPFGVVTVGTFFVYRYFRICGKEVTARRNVPAMVGVAAQIGSMYQQNRTGSQECFLRTGAVFFVFRKKSQEE